MKRSGRKVEWPEVEANALLHDKIIKIMSNEKHRDAMLKDVLLIEAALATDETVLSLDEVVRGLFSGLCHQVKQINEIIWVNPVIAEEKCIEWLREGAPAEKHRMLSYIGTED
jgi:hypothetical protein